MQWLKQACAIFPGRNKNPRPDLAGRGSLIVGLTLYCTRMNSLVLISAHRMFS
jgi:hypothetical protein